MLYTYDSFLKVERVIKFNQNVWLRPYIDMNTGLRKKANDLKKLMNNSVFGKNYGKCEKT